MNWFLWLLASWLILNLISDLVTIGMKMAKDESGAVIFGHVSGFLVHVFLFVGCYHYVFTK